jgi:hypothetical protein
MWSFTGPRAATASAGQTAPGSYLRTFALALREQLAQTISVYSVLRENLGRAAVAGNICKRAVLGGKTALKPAKPISLGSYYNK